MSYEPRYRDERHRGRRKEKEILPYGKDYVLERKVITETVEDGRGRYPRDSGGVQYAYESEGRPRDAGRAEYVYESEGRPRDAGRVEYVYESEGRPRDAGRVEYVYESEGRHSYPPPSPPPPPPLPAVRYERAPKSHSSSRGMCSKQGCCYNRGCGQGDGGYVSTSGFGSDGCNEYGCQYGRMDNTRSMAGAYPVGYSYTTAPTAYPGVAGMPPVVYPSNGRFPTYPNFHHQNGFM